MIVSDKDGKDLNAPGSAAYYGQMLEFILPESFPAIAGMTYATTSQIVDSNSQTSINVPSNIERLLGFAVFSADSSDLAWTTGIRMSLSLQTETLLDQVPVALAVTQFNSALQLGYLPWSRPCKQGDSLVFAFTSNTTAISMYVVAVFQKLPAALI